ncbi:MAG: response regulator transcription factor [Solirubrobacteraceae bacterium]
MAPQAPAARVVIADRRLAAVGGAGLLPADPRIEIVGTAADGVEAVTLAAGLLPDVAMLELELPLLGGLEACATIRTLHPDTEVVVVAESEHAPDLIAALRVGARGFLLADASPAQSLEVVLDTARGQPQLSGRIAAQLLHEFAAGASSRGDALVQLSPRERDVLVALADGFCNREAAKRLRVSQAAVGAHVRQIIDKLHLRNRSEAAALATRHQG